MPGQRIEMEDATCHVFPVVPAPGKVGEFGPLTPPPKQIREGGKMAGVSNNNSNNNKNINSLMAQKRKQLEKDEGDDTNAPVAFFGIFDGHGDGGLASGYVARNLIHRMTTTDEWTRWDDNYDDTRNEKEEEDSVEGCSSNTSLNNNMGGMITSAISKACIEVDEGLHTLVAGGKVNGGRAGGTTGVVTIISHESIVVANIGDCRCILVRGERSNNEEIVGGLGERNIIVKPLSIDHTPGLPYEKERVMKAGMKVIEDTIVQKSNSDVPITTTIHRIQRDEIGRERLSVTRAFGDFDYKANVEIDRSEQAVVCDPDIVVYPRSREMDSAGDGDGQNIRGVEDLYLILACDGVWDVMSNDEVGAFVSRRVSALRLEGSVDGEAGFGAGTPSPSSPSVAAASVLPVVGDELLAECLRKGSADNMSVLIVAFPPLFYAGESDTNNYDRGESGEDSYEEGEEKFSKDKKEEVRALNFDIE